MGRLLVAHIDAAVHVEVHDPDVIARATGPKGDEWRAVAYNLHTEADARQPDSPARRESDVQRNS